MSHDPPTICAWDIFGFVRDMSQMSHGLTQIIVAFLELTFDRTG